MNIKAPGTYVILLLAGICCFLLTVKNPRHPCSSTEDSFGDDIPGQHIRLMNFAFSISRMLGYTMECTSSPIHKLQIMTLELT